MSDGIFILLHKSWPLDMITGRSLKILIFPEKGRDSHINRAKRCR